MALWDSSRRVSSSWQHPRFTLARDPPTAPPSTSPAELPFRASSCGVGQRARARAVGDRSVATRAPRGRRAISHCAAAAPRAATVARASPRRRLWARCTRDARSRCATTERTPRASRATPAARHTQSSARTASAPCCTSARGHARSLRRSTKPLRSGLTGRNKASVVCPFEWNWVRH